MKCLHYIDLSIFDASERSDRVARRPHKSIYALRTLISVRAPIWHSPSACWAEFEPVVESFLKLRVDFTDHVINKVGRDSHIQPAKHQTYKIHRPVLV